MPAKLSEGRFKARVKRKLRVHRMTFGQLADVCGVDATTISRFLNGRTEIRSGALFKMMDWADARLGGTDATENQIGHD